MTGLQQHGWAQGAQPQHLPSEFHPWNKSNSPSACAAVVRPKVTTTALQILIHFMTRSLLPLGFGSWAVCIPARRAGKLIFEGDSPPTWFGGGGRRRRASLVRDHPTAVAPVPDDKTFWTTSATPSCVTVPTRVPCPCQLFQTIFEVAPSRSVCEGLEQSIGAT